MCQLDFRTENFAHGTTGLLFSSNEEFFYTLGFLSNINHYYGCGPVTGMNNNLITINIENNDRSGANSIEGRIHFYGTDIQLRNFPALYNAKSAGRGNILHRINCLLYLSYLIKDFHFQTTNPQDYTINYFPPAKNIILAISENKLNNFSLEEKTRLISIFEQGYRL